MRNLKRLSILTSAALLLALGTHSVGASSQSQEGVRVTVYRVAQIDNLDKELPFFEDRADFYAQVWLEGAYFRSANMSKNDGEPNWSFFAPATTRYVNVRIKLMDDDGELEGTDEPLDINPAAGKKTLDFVFDRLTGRISGDISGTAGTMFHSMGHGDRSRAEIWFTVH